VVEVVVSLGAAAGHESEPASQQLERVPVDAHAPGPGSLLQARRRFLIKTPDIQAGHAITHRLQNASG
jgi:hypothetical protein